MFIETLEFTIPVDLCDLFSSLKRGPRSNMEFPASVNSYGTTQDANIQVLLRANKLTFKVDGVSSNSSMISKSECKTLKLSVFDVDCSIDAQEEEVNVYRNVYSEPRLQNTHSNASKRTRDYSVPEPSPPSKSSRISFSESPHSRNIPQQSSSRPSIQTPAKSHNDLVNVKQEPEDPDLIEIEPDPEPDDIVPKKETPYMQIDYSSEVPHTQTSQAALERLSHPHQQSSHSQSPASSSSSFHQNVPHVPDYAEPGPSQVHHGDQSADDFLVFQEDNDDGDDNEADYSNDDLQGSIKTYHSPKGGQIPRTGSYFQPQSDQSCLEIMYQNPALFAWKGGASSSPGQTGSCPDCGKVFTTKRAMLVHKAAVHENQSYFCVCGKQYKYAPGLLRHHQSCAVWKLSSLSQKGDL